MKDEDLILAFGRLEGSIVESRKALDEKLIEIKDDIKQIHQEQKESTMERIKLKEMIVEVKNNFNWVKKLFGFAYAMIIAIAGFVFK